mmetsp:Transcript_2412/g.3534  ORF Transcript_2412/g.3534 Transcript_2412/m.3534 type:complete len:425 (+) Transcript_2412:116-1390(+)
MSRLFLVWVSLFAAVHGVHGARTCADDDAFNSFVVEVRNFDLRDRNGKKVGSANVEAVARTKENGEPSVTNCFRLSYSVEREFTIRKLAAGIYIQGAPIPDGAGRYTKRKQVSDGSVQITEERMDICPSRVATIDASSCCENAFEIIGGALIQGVDSSRPKQAWLSPSSNCRQVDENNPFQLACTMGIECGGLSDCPPGTCKIGSECFPSSVAKSKLGCGITEEVVATASGECNCRQCSPSQCFNGERCFEDEDYTPSCPSGKVANPESVLCECKPLCSNDSCFIGSQCFKLQNVTAIPEFDALGCRADEGIGASDSGECICERCASNECSSGLQCFNRFDYTDMFCRGRRNAESADPDEPTCTCRCINPVPGSNPPRSTCMVRNTCREVIDVACIDNGNQIATLPLIVDDVCLCPPGTSLGTN